MIKLSINEENFASDGFDNHFHFRGNGQLVLLPDG
jgi:hypothetical protein